MNGDEKATEPHAPKAALTNRSEKADEISLLNRQDFLEHPAAFLSIFTISSVAYALFFNIGYYYPLGIEFLTFLTLTDVLEATLPFMLVGLVSILAIMFIDVLADDDEPIKQKFRRFFIDEIVEFPAVVRYLARIVITPFFLFNLIGSYILYYWFYIRIQSFSNTVSMGENLNVFNSGIVPWVVAALVVVLMDLFIRSRPKQYKVRKLIMRLLVLSIAICVFEGSAFLARQLGADTKWDVELKNGRILADRIVLRSTERGILVFERGENSVGFIVHDELKSVRKSLKSAS